MFDILYVTVKPELILPPVVPIPNVRSETCSTVFRIQKRQFNLKIK